jgi:hypothetical protein
MQNQMDMNTPQTPTGLIRSLYTPNADGESINARFQPNADAAVNPKSTETTTNIVSGNDQKY